MHRKLRVTAAAFVLCALLSACGAPAVPADLQTTEAPETILAEPHATTEAEIPSTTETEAPTTTQTETPTTTQAKIPETTQSKAITTTQTKATTTKREESSALTSWKSGDKYPTVTITMADGGVIKAELYPDKAPNTVNNFISLVNSGYFEGKIFHRVIPGFMIQGGSPNGDGMSMGFPYSIAGEFRNNGFTGNNIAHRPGVLSMARAGNPDSGGCQFFIMHGESGWLDGDYAGFGMVTEGMDVVDRIANLPRDGRDRPAAPPAIRSVTAETYGVAYPEPVTIPSR